MCAKHYENPTMLSRVTAKNVGDVFFETHCSNNSQDNIYGAVIMRAIARVHLIHDECRTAQSGCQLT